MRRVHSSWFIVHRWNICIIFALVLACLILPQAVCLGATYYVSPAGGGSQDGSSPTNAFSITLARNYSINHPNEEITFLLASGNYGRYWEAVGGYAGGVGIEQTIVNRTAWHTWKADTGATVIFTQIRFRPYGQTKPDVQLIFEGINVQVPLPDNLPDPTDPPWPGTGACVSIELGANYIQIRNAKLTGAHKYLTYVGVRIDSAENVVVHHCEITKAAGGVLACGCKNIVVSYNYCHALASGSIIKFDGGGSFASNSLIIGNHIHDAHQNPADDYHPPTRLDLDPVVYPQGSPPALIDAQPGQKGEEVWSTYEDSGTLHTAKGEVLSVKWDTTEGNYVVYLRETVSAREGYFGTAVSKGAECVSQTSNITFIPIDHHESFHTGSVMSMRVSNITVRNNILHDFPGQGIRLYIGSGPYTNIVEENNLAYDIVNGNGLFEVNGPCVVRNNTFIGFAGSDGWSRNDIPARYDTDPFGIRFWPGFDGTGVQMYNNILVDRFNFPAQPCQEDYNIAWAGEHQGGHSFKAVWQEPAPSYILRGWSNYFEDLTKEGIAASSLKTPEYDYEINGVQPFFVNPGFYTGPVGSPESAKVKSRRDVGKVWDYRLFAGSPAINFGATQVATWEEVLSGAVTGPSQPPDSLGTIGPDGFIREDGQPRDADYHSVGCYEFVPDETPPTIPQNLVAKTINQNQIDLTWSAATDPDSGISHYRIYRNGTKVATSPIISYSDTGLIPGNIYTYEVSAVNGVGLESEKSSSASETTLPDLTPASVPENLNAQAISQTQIDLTWPASIDPESGIKHYNIYRDGGLINTSTTNSYSDTGLIPATTYTYQVSAVNGSGEESARSSSASCQTLADIEPPLLVSVNFLSETSLEITFSEPLEPTSAQDINNYSINNGISVIAATLRADRKAVTLTTTPHTEGIYTLTVRNIKDDFQNQMPVTQRNYLYKPGLILYLGMDGNLKDASVFSNDGLWRGNPKYSEGICGQALGLDGTNYIEVPNLKNVLKAGSAGDFTISIWVKTNNPAINYQKVWSIFDNGYTGIWTYNSRFRFGITSGYYSYLPYAQAIINGDQWYHIVVSVAGGSWSYYLNGKFDHTYNPGVSLASFKPDYNFNIGNSWQGTIDELMVFNRALGSAEILELSKRPPVLALIGDKSVNENELLTFVVSATDGDGDSLTYSAKNLPTGASFEPLTQTFSWRPTYEQAGIYPAVHFEVSDGRYTDSEEIAITVNNVNLFKYGDVNSDGEVTAYDAALAAHIAVELEHPDIKNRAAAEVSGDGEVDAYDAALIAQRAVGLIEKFPVE